ncbi:MAG: retinol dehydrogenase [Candidatus Schekmanbacteria bacterium]|nr:retinol dehydrogenase [Candidatus Schekmanbacteria bacterium]
MNRLGVITNPNSKKNRHQHNRAEKLQRIVGDRGTVVQTACVEEIGPALDRFDQEGVDCWVSDGGDGAFHWLINTALRERPGALPLVLPANGGTIDFVAKKAGIRGQCEDILRELSAVCGGARAFPVVHVGSLVLEGTMASGAPFRRYGFACAAGGIGQRFFDKYYEHLRPGPVTILRVVGRAVGSLVLWKLGAAHVDPRAGRYAREIFRPTQAEVRIDGEKVPSTTHGAIHAGAINVNLGGVFQVFPLARQDGRLHFQAGTITPLEMVKNLPNLWRGERIASRGLVETAGTLMTIAAASPEDLSPVLDGEIFSGLRELSIRVGPTFPIPAVRPRAGGIPE